MGKATLALLALTLPGAAAADAAASVRRVDREFALQVAEQGQTAAFLEYLADDAVLLRPLPVPARRWLEDRVAPEGRLSWTPELLQVSCDATLAVSIGPWTYLDPQGRVAGSGWYLTLWRRGEDGDWRIAFDQSLDSSGADPGSATPAQPPESDDEAMVETGDAADDGHGDCVAAEDRLAAAERDLNKAGASRGQAAALRKVTASPLLVLRDGQSPSSQPPPPRERGADRMLADTRGAYSTPTGDLALTYGELRPRSPPSATGATGVQGVYVRVWQYDGRRWRVRVDTVSVVPDAVAGPP